MSRLLLPSIFLLACLTAQAEAIRPSAMAGDYKIHSKKGEFAQCPTEVKVVLNATGVHYLGNNDSGQSFLYADSGCKKTEGGPNSDQCTIFKADSVREYEYGLSAFGYMKLETKLSLSQKDILTYKISGIMIPMGILIKDMDTACTFTRK